MFKNILIPTDGSKKTGSRFLAAIEKEAKAARVKYSGLSIDDVAPWEAIVEAAKKKKCDLIFMGSHGRTEISGLLIGSQAAKVPSHSTIPVLVHK